MITRFEKFSRFAFTLDGNFNWVILGKNIKTNKGNVINFFNYIMTYDKDLPKEKTKRINPTLEFKVDYRLD